MRITIPNGFTPRPYQRKYMAYFDGGGKHAVWVVHRRGGKDLTAMHQTCKMMHERKGTYWHVFPTAEQARRSIWTEFTKDGDRIMEQVFPKALRKTPLDWAPQAEMVVELKCGSIWRLIGSDKIEVAGAGPVGVVFSEYALAKPKTWDFVRPMIRERDGWASFVSTPRGKNHLWERWNEAGIIDGWWRDIQPLHATRAFDPEQTIAEERAAGMPEALIRQEYLCDWTAANVGSVWGELIEELGKRGGLGFFAHELDGVFTTWDLGVSDATAIWFWRINGERSVDLIDHYEATSKPMSHYFDVLDQRGYGYAKHWLPHDAKQRTWQTGVSTVDLFIERFGAEMVGLTPALTLADGIQAARWLLQQPMRAHPRCEEGLEALRQYHYIWDEDQKVFGSKPEHDWSSHTADAFRYVGVVAKMTEQITRPADKQAAKPVAVPIDKSFTLDALFEARDRERRS
jgi:phage terminase large subunit